MIGSRVASSRVSVALASVLVLAALAPAMEELEVAPGTNSESALLVLPPGVAATA